MALQTSGLVEELQLPEALAAAIVGADLLGGSLGAAGAVQHVHHPVLESEREAPADCFYVIISYLFFPHPSPSLWVGWVGGLDC